MSCARLIPAFLVVAGAVGCVGASRVRLPGLASSEHPILAQLQPLHTYVQVRQVAVDDLRGGYRVVLRELIPIPEANGWRRLFVTDVVLNVPTNLDDARVTALSAGFRTATEAEPVRRDWWLELPTWNHGRSYFSQPAYLEPWALGDNAGLVAAVAAAILARETDRAHLSGVQRQNLEVGVEGIHQTVRYRVGVSSDLGYDDSRAGWVLEFRLPVAFGSPPVPVSARGTIATRSGSVAVEGEAQLDLIQSSTERVSGLLRLRIRVGEDEVLRTFAIDGPYFALPSPFLTDELLISGPSEESAELDRVADSSCTRAIEVVSVGATDVRICASLEPVF